MNFIVLLLGLIPSFVWLSFFLQEDLHPEPRKMIFAAFLSGIVAALGTYILQVWMSSALLANGITSRALAYVAAFALVEETIKLLAAYLVVRKSPDFDEPIDAMIYLVAVAMGFAAVENIAVAFTNGLAVITIGSLMFRFLGATLLHALSSSVVGYYWARGLVTRHVGIFVLLGIVVATLLHTVFNYAIVVFENGFLYAIGILVFAAFFVLYDFEKLKKNDTIIS